MELEKWEKGSSVFHKPYKMNCYDPKVSLEWVIKSLDPRTRATNRNKGKLHCEVMPEWDIYGHMYVCVLECV